MNFTEDRIHLLTRVREVRGLVIETPGLSSWMSDFATDAPRPLHIGISYAVWHR